jgi:proliferating cell nuclear antigen
MKLTLADSKHLRDSVSIISDLVHEARFKVSSDALELIAMDPANVAMVIFKLLSSSFTEYEVGEETELALNLNNLKTVLKRAKPNDILSLELESGKLKVELKSNTTRTFYLPIIELEDKDHRIPDLSFPVSVKMSSSMLSEAIDDVDIVGESVSFGVEEGKLIVSAEGDLQKAKVEIPQDDNTNIQATEELIKAKYSIEYLKKMVQGSKLSSDVLIQFNKDYPLKLEFKALDKLLLSFILAPRVDND